MAKNERLTNSASAFEDPGVDFLKEALRKSLDPIKCNSNTIALSRDEAERFEKAFDDNEFRKLMAAYVSEISDPKYRAEQDAYIQELESQNEIPKGKQIVRPLPGFALKFKCIKIDKLYKKHSQSSNPKKNRMKKSKLFINIVYSDKIDKPISKSAQTSNGQHVKKSGMEWSVPYSLGPLRMEEDNNNVLIPTFDCCFHSEALKYAAKNMAFRDLISQTAREGVIEQFKSRKEEVEIDPNYHILKGTNYKNGIPPAMITSASEHSRQSSEKYDLSVRNKHSDDAVNTEKSHKIAQSNNKTFGDGLKTAFLIQSKKSVRVPKRKGKTDRHVSSYEEGFVGEMKGGGETSEGKFIPEYELIEQGDFEITDHTIGELQRPSTRPKRLLIKISLPKIKSAKEVCLDVSEDQLDLLSHQNCESNYHLKLKLPYPVSSDEGTAKYEKSRSLLIVTLPVYRPPGIPSWAVISNDNVEDEALQEDCTKVIDDAASMSDSSCTPDSPVLVEKPSLDEEAFTPDSPVLVDRPPPSHHYKWVDIKKDNGEVTREEFATDSVLPKCNPLEDEIDNIMRKRISKENNSSEKLPTNRLLDGKTNKSPMEVDKNKLNSSALTDLKNRNITKRNGEFFDSASNLKPTKSKQQIWANKEETNKIVQSTSDFLNLQTKLQVPSACFESNLIFSLD